MNTVQTLQINSTSSAATLDAAAQVGSKLKGGETIELVSDLGGGKTTFTRGLAKGMGYKGNVRSPSFTLSNQYQAGGKTMHHFDFYRLIKAGIMKQELAEVLEDQQAIVVVEWAKIIDDVLPNNRLIVELQITSENSRAILISYPSNLAYLMENLTD